MDTSDLSVNTDGFVLQNTPYFFILNGECCIFLFLTLSSGSSHYIITFPMNLLSQCQNTKYKAANIHSWCNCPCGTEYAWRGAPCGGGQSLHRHPRVPTEYGHWLLEDGVSGEYTRHRHDHEGGGARTGERFGSVEGLGNIMIASVYLDVELQRLIDWVEMFLYIIFPKQVAYFSLPSSFLLAFSSIYS